MDIRCRIAPSPTGPLHIGTARTALYNYLFARRSGGTFVLRLEDTDAARNSLAFERDILEGLVRLGIGWDEGPEVAGQPARGPYGPYRQTERLPHYAAAAERLQAKDLAYPCYCSPEELAADRAAQKAAHEPPHYVGRCAHLSSDQRRAREADGRRPAIRFRIPPDETIVFDDLIRGRVEIATAALGGDLVIVRSDGSPLYHFSVCVDDAEMAMSHIIRGEDHLSNTPKHILLFRALGAPVPTFAHLPLILNPDRTKMSKRKTQTAVSDYLAQGYVPEAIVNHLALLGWASGGTEELFSLDELVAIFDLERVHQAGAIFDRERLDWLDGQWIRRLEPHDLARRLLPFLEADLAAKGALGLEIEPPSESDLVPLVPLVQERLPTLAAIGDLIDFLFIRELALEPALLLPKRWDRETTLAALHAARQTIAALGPVSFDAEALEPALRALAEERVWKAGDLFMAIRVAVTGRTAAPPLFATLVALGYARTIERLDRARELLAGSA